MVLLYLTNDPLSIYLAFFKLFRELPNYFVTPYLKIILTTYTISTNIFQNCYPIKILLNNSPHWESSFCFSFRKMFSLVHQQFLWIRTMSRYTKTSFWTRDGKTWGRLWVGHRCKGYWVLSIIPFSNCWRKHRMKGQLSVREIQPVGSTKDGEVTDRTHML